MSKYDMACKIIIEREADHTRRMALAFRAAQCDQRAFQKFMNELGKTANSKPPKTAKHLDMKLGGGSGL